MNDQPLDQLHHVAVSVKDIAEAVQWYQKHFRCKVSYQDETWAMLDFENLQIALVIPAQHPPHVAFVHPHPEKYGTLKPHRDGTKSLYITDPTGNAVELMSPDGLAPRS